jgi:hypothetical protein
MISAKREPTRKTNDKDRLLARIYQAILQVKHGSVQIHIQDGKVIQIDKLDKIRMR